MALSITSAVRENGASCDHVTVTVNHEGVSRVFTTSFPQIDQLIDDLGGPVNAQKALVLLWAAYRRHHSRAVLNVEIA